MKHKAMLVSVMVLALLSAKTSSSEQSPYSGEETRAIKALSERAISGLLAGKGMGYAKAAELNGYPGPAHVLELDEELGLDAEQEAQTVAIFEEMEIQAKRLGADLVEAERALDQAFRNQTVDQSTLPALVREIGEIESRLRTVHLQAHLQQAELLSERQTARYMALRGYQTEASHHSSDSHKHGE